MHVRLLLSLLMLLTCGAALHTPSYGQTFEHARAQAAGQSLDMAIDLAASNSLCLTDFQGEYDGAALTSAQCLSDLPTGTREHVWLRGSVETILSGSNTAVLNGDITRFESLEIFLINPDGAVSSRRYSHQDTAKFAAWGAYFAIPLDWAAQTPTQVLVRIDKPWSASTITEMTVANAAEFAKLDRQRGYIVMFMAGFIVMVIAANFLLAIATKDRAARYMLIMLAGGVLFFASSTNLILGVFPEFPMDLRWRMSYAGAAIVGLIFPFFVLAFLEAKIIPNALAKAWIVAGCIPIGAQIGIQLFANTLVFKGSTYHHMSFIPMLVVYLAVVAFALLKKSKQAWVVIAAFSMFYISAGMRIFGAVNNEGASALLSLSMHLSMFVTFLVLLYPITQRMMRIRMDRDNSREAAKLAQRDAEHDPLTGLWNRRGFERVWEPQEFTALALIDLDHFKHVNDTYGHEVGDDVLIATAAALSIDPQVVPFRFGGEEFVLLVRDDQAEHRVEALRRQVEKQIRLQVGNLVDRQTASAGIARINPSHSSPDQAFGMADSALYKAKENGRNRLLICDSPAEMRETRERFRITAANEAA